MYQEGTDHLIWSNYHTDFEDWKESTSEDYEDYSEDRLYEIFCEAISDTKDLQKIRQLIRGVDDKSGILIKLSNESDQEQWGNVKPEGKQFAIEVFPLGERYVVSALQLRKLYGGITIQMKVLHSEISDNELHAVRLFKPEQYIPFYFMESDLDGIENLLPRMQNLFYAYQVMRYRMIKYYANFVGVEPIQNSMKKIDGF